MLSRPISQIGTSVVTFTQRFFAIVSALVGLFLTPLTVLVASKIAASAFNDGLPYPSDPVKYWKFYLLIAVIFFVVLPLLGLGAGNSVTKNVVVVKKDPTV